MNKSILTLLFVCFTTSLLAQAPVIFSFSPLTANVGSAVTINGSGFDATPVNNIVFFGAVKANVLTASATSLTVTVPAGAAFEPIRVTKAGLTAYSTLPFTPTFSNSDPFTINSFPRSVEKDLIRISHSHALTTSDLDGDGRPDIISPTEFDSISIFLNQSIDGNISLRQWKSFKTPAFIYGYSIADFDGDGKQDIVTVNPYNNNVSVFKNISTPGNLDLEARIDFSTGLRPQFIVTTDLDADGKPDIITANYDDSSVSILKNTTTGGNISFAPKTDLRTGVNPSCVSVADLDGDSRADIITTNYSTNDISILKNTSPVNTIQFDPKIDIQSGQMPRSVIAVDLDGDSKIDLVTTDQGSNAVSVYQNNGSPGSISFLPRAGHVITTTANTYPIVLSTGDIDGDGKPDLLAGCFTESIYPMGLSVLLKNTSSGSTIGFGMKTEFPGGPFMSMYMNDLQGDGKPDILEVIPTDYNSYLRILRNKIGEPVDIVMCPSFGYTTLSSNLAGTNYQWQVSTDSVNFFDINNSAFYSGTNSASLQLNGIPSSAYGNVYQCIVDGGRSERFAIKFQNEWRWLGTHSNWEDAGAWSCGTLPDANTDVFITNGASITLNSNTTIRSLTILPGAHLTISPGYNLTILH